MTTSPEARFCFPLFVVYAKSGMRLCVKDSYLSMMDKFVSCFRFFRLQILLLLPMFFSDGPSVGHVVNPSVSVEYFLFCVYYVSKVVDS